MNRERKRTGLTLGVTALSIVVACLAIGSCTQGDTAHMFVATVAGVTAHVLLLVFAFHGDF